MKACKENRVHEAFGTGTAAIVSPVKSFIYHDETYKIPIDEVNGAGPLAQRILHMMSDV